MNLIEIGKWCICMTLAYLTILPIAVASMIVLLINLKTPYVIIGLNQYFVLVIGCMLFFLFGLAMFANFYYQYFEEQLEELRQIKIRKSFGQVVGWKEKKKF